MAAAAGQARLHVLARGQVLDLASAAAKAAEVEADDPQMRAELAFWTGRTRPDGTGLPPGVLPERHAQTTVPVRQFGRLALRALRRAGQRQVNLFGHGEQRLREHVPPALEAPISGDEDVEGRVRVVRRNAAIVVHRVQRAGL